MNSEQPTKRLKKAPRRSKKMSKKESPLTVAKLKEVSPEIEKPLTDEELLLKSIKLKPSKDRTHIIVVVVDQDQQHNTVQRIRCMHGLAFRETYPYEQATDSYIIPCVVATNLGYISLSYTISIDSDPWTQRLLLPVELVKRHLNPQQLAVLSGVESKYSHPRYKFNIIQMAGCDA